jgi:hypothetical protein
MVLAPELWQLYSCVMGPLHEPWPLPASAVALHADADAGLRLTQDTAHKLSCCYPGLHPAAGWRWFDMQDAAHNFSCFSVLMVMLFLVMRLRCGCRLALV